MNVPWIDLPSDIWLEIAQHVDNVLDRFRFRSVCKLWRSSLPSPTSVTLTSIPSPPFGLVKEKTIYRVDGNFPLSRGKQPLIILEQIYHDNCTTNTLKFRIHHLFYDVNVKNRPRELNVVSNDCFSLSNVAKYHYAMSNHNRHNDKATELKVVVINDVKVALLDRELTGKLAVLRGDALQWKTIKCTRKFDDIVEYKGKFFAIDRHGEGFILDCNTFEISQIVTPEIKGYQLVLKRKRLVMDTVNGVLYLLVSWDDSNHCDGITARIKVYALSEDGSKWSEVQSIGNRALVVGRVFSFCFREADIVPYVGIDFTDCIFCHEISSFPCYNEDPRQLSLREYNGYDNVISFYNIRDERWFSVPKIV